MSYDAEHLLDSHPAIDYIVRGEGEAVLLELLLALTNQTEISPIKGVHIVKEIGVPAIPTKRD